MKHILSIRHRRQKEKGVALIIVLTFLVLLTGLVVAYFARSMTALQVSNSSSSETKASILAISATSVIIGDLRQEIVAGSSSSNGGNASWPLIYTPLSAVTMSPFRTGIPTGSATAIPNLISRSVRPGNTSGDSPTVPYPTGTSAYTNPPQNRAAEDSATPDKVKSTTPSLNGRFVSLSRWNSHYLIPRKNPTTSSDSTPVDSFIAPDWVVITRNGAKSVSWNSNLADNSLINGNYAVGRYAFAVYDEGGLLDLNVAGYPADPVAGGPNGLSSAQIGRKGSLALADLKQLPDLTQNEINNIVGWRNYASSQPAGSYNNFIFDATSATKWLNNFALNNTTGFLKIPSLSYGVPPQTDQAILSRQQLLNLRKSIGFSENALQYLGTFSRALEQPSYVPPSLRYPTASNVPKINKVGSTVPPPAATVDSYLGNNDDAGSSGGVPIQDLYNPSFLSVRVSTAFTRNNGTAAVVGEPLVKTKFALSNLALLSSAPAVVGTSSDIYKRFGLTRSSASAPWIYNHGNNYIKSLSLVATAQRDPDFAELLRAAINSGSLAKGGPGLHNNQGNYQYTLDTAVDYQVLQIMANLIDQYDEDSYPTQIQIQAGSGAGAVQRVFRGVEDLPYFYRYHQFTAVTRRPSPLLSKDTDRVSFANAVTPGSPYLSTATRPVAMGSLSDPGEAIMFYIPEVWNPHDANGLVTSSASGRPTAFQLTAATRDPLSQTAAWRIKARPSGLVSSNVLPDTARSAVSTPTELKTTDTAIQFSDVNGTLFREPTLLWRPSYPTGINMTGGALVRATDANTGNDYIGIPVGRTPISFIYAPTTSGSYNGGTALPSGTQYIFQANALDQDQLVLAGSYAQITFRLQYRDGSGNWITYDEKYPDLHGLYRPDLVVNTADWPNNAWKNPFRTNALSDRATSYDPRTARFGIGTAAGIGAGATNGPALEATLQTNYNNNTSAANNSIGTSNFTVLESQRARPDRGQQVNYSTPGMTSDPGKNAQIHWFSGVGYSASNGQSTAPLFWDGLLSQNNPAMTIKARDNSTDAKLYYADADGVARRAMGAYAATNVMDAVASINPTGMPHVTASVVPMADGGVATPRSDGQSQSRPIILNRAFRSVSEMSYAFRGSPWKNIDFFTPESGDSALLDTFCLNEPPANGIVAGKVNLNTRQTKVLQAIIAGAYKDELKNLSSAPAYALNPIDSTEAATIAQKLVDITSDTTAAWRGPLANVSELVGRFIPVPGSVGSATDVYQFVEPVTNTTFTYAGFSAALESTMFTGSTAVQNSNARIQRFREAALRPLVDSGQTRVWNLMIDVIAQSGRYPKTATGLNQFMVEGEKRQWIHVAIDRYTGEVLDMQVEVVTE